jgi:hypothetical protein
MIPYGKQSISEEDIAAVVSVLRSDFLTQGPVVPQFEQAVAQNVDAAYAVAVNSSTSALHISCLTMTPTKCWFNAFAATGSTAAFELLGNRRYSLPMNIRLPATIRMFVQARRLWTPSNRSHRAGAALLRPLNTLQLNV